MYLSWSFRRNLGIFEYDPSLIDFLLFLIKEDTRSLIFSTAFACIDAKTEWLVSILLVFTTFSCLFYCLLNSCEVFVISLPFFLLICTCSGNAFCTTFLAYVLVQGSFEVICISPNAYLLSLPTGYAGTEQAFLFPLPFKSLFILQRFTETCLLPLFLLRVMV